MICLNCGYCCIKYDVIIIHPNIAYNDNLDIKELKDDGFLHKPADVICPHAEIKDNKLYCKVHNYKWYKNTPCYDFTQIELNDQCKCRMGDYINYNPTRFNFNDFEVLKYAE